MVKGTNLIAHRSLLIAFASSCRPCTGIQSPAHSSSFPCGLWSPASPASPAATWRRCCSRAATRCTACCTGRRGARAVGARRPASARSALHRADVADPHAVGARGTPRRARRRLPSRRDHVRSRRACRSGHALRVNVLGATHLIDRGATRAATLPRADGRLRRCLRRGAADDLPVRESCPFRPLSPYGATKAALDLLAYQWARTCGARRGAGAAVQSHRAGSAAEFVCPDFARQLVE